MPDGQARHGRDDARQYRSDLSEVARVNAHLAIASVDLDANSVELPLHRRPFEARHGLRHVGAGRREHRKDRPEDLKANFLQSLLAVGHGDLGHPRKIAGEHQRTPGDRAGHAGGLGDGIGHQPGQRPLSELAREQASEKAGLLLGRLAHKLGQEAPAFSRGAAAGRCLDVGDRSINVADGKRRLGRRPTLQPMDSRIADPDAPLPRNP